MTSRLKGLVKNGGIYSSSSGTGIGDWPSTCGDILSGHFFHLNLSGENVFVFGINDNGPFVESVHVGPIGDVVYGCGNTYHTICQ